MERQSWADFTLAAGSGQAEDDDMGAWGIGSFENDKALDWIHEFRSNPSERTLLDVFEGKFPPPHSGILDRMLGRDVRQPKHCTDEYVVAAAEVIAALLGRPPGPLPEDLAELPEVVIGEEVVGKAVEAIREVLADSNLKSCFEGSPDYGDWLLGVLDLRDRLGRG